MTLRKIFWDFDGVICDSALEAFRVSLAALDVISEIESDEKDHLFQEFMEFRRDVGPAWNYYFIFDYLLHKRRSEWRLNEQAEGFEQVFLATRKQVMAEKIDAWAQLHVFYPKVINLINQFPGFVHTIITNKNTEAVRFLVEKCGSKSLADCEIHSLFGTRRSKAQVLADLSFSVNDIFIDDHLSTVIQCRNIFGKDYKILHADWGYGHADAEYSITQLGLKDLIGNLLYES